MNDTIVFSIGRFNPISTGHQKVVDLVSQKAHELGADHKIFPTSSHDAAKNPLSFNDKILYMKRFFPDSNIMEKEGYTLFSILLELQDEGYKNLCLVVGGDRAEEFSTIIRKYMGSPETDYKPYYFQHVEVISAGDRTEDNNVSGTKMRDSAKNGKDGEFINMAPGNDIMLKRKMLNSVKRGLQVEANLMEGVYDKNIFKVIFLGGPPGSGKDYVLRKTVSSFGLVEINSDRPFEAALRKAGLSLKMPDEERDDRDRVRNRSKITTSNKLSLAIDGRLGIIVNSTGSDFDKLADQKTLFEAIGYETAMLFVNVDDDVSKERNFMRGERGNRSVPENIRSDKYKESMNARRQYSHTFSPYWEIDNNSTDASSNETKFYEYFKQIKRWMDSPVTNSVAEGWKRYQMTKKTGINEDMNINEMFEEFVKTLNEGPLEGEESAKIYKEMTPGQEDAPVPHKKKTLKEMRANKSVNPDELLEDTGYDGINLPEGMTADSWEVYKILFAGIQDGSLTEEKLETMIPMLEENGIDPEPIMELSRKTLLSYTDKAHTDQLKKQKEDKWGKAFHRAGGQTKARMRLHGTTPKQLKSIRDKNEEKDKLNEAKSFDDYKDHTKSGFHKTLTKHGFEHVSTNYQGNDRPSNSRYIHAYKHPNHPKDHVEAWHWGDGQKSFHGRHKQKSNDILAPSTGDTKGQLDRTLTRHYGTKA